MSVVIVTQLYKYISHRIVQVKQENYNSIKKNIKKEKEETIHFGPSVASQDNSLTSSPQPALCPGPGSKAEKTFESRAENQ